MKKDIETRADIEQLISVFYEKILADEVIGFIFTDVVKLDFEKHIPVICDFWESILLHTSSYKGNVMHKHMDLDKKVKLLPEHFDRWTKTFLETTAQFFEGDVTDELIKRVNMIAPFMRYKVEASRDKNNLI